MLINILSTIRHERWPPWNTNDQSRLMSLQAYFDFSMAAKYLIASPSFTIVSLSLFWNIFSYFDEFWCINKILSLYYSSDTQKLLPCRTSCLKGIRYIGHIVSNDAYHILNAVVSPCIFKKKLCYYSVPQMRSISPFQQDYSICNTAFYFLIFSQWHLT